MTDLKEFREECLQDPEFKKEYEKACESAELDGVGLTKISISPETGKPSFKEIKLQEFYRDLE